MQKNRFYIGIDCSKYKIHLAILNANSQIVKLSILESSEKKDIERMGELLEKFEDWLIEFIEEKDISNDDVVVTVEGPIFLQNVKTSFDIARSVNAIEMTCYSIFVKCFEVQNTSWKKSIIGNGSCSKEDIMKFAKVKWGDKTFKEQDHQDHQDHADAACIALHQLILLSVDLKK